MPANAIGLRVNTTGFAANAIAFGGKVITFAAIVITFRVIGIHFVYRNSIGGRFTTQKKAEESPSTTEKHQVRTKKPH